MKRVVTFKIEEELLDKLDRYATRNGLNRSQAIRKAIELLLRNEKNIDGKLLEINVERSGFKVL
mgnify:CR=1 FL=1